VSFLLKGRDIAATTAPVASGAIKILTGILAPIVIASTHFRPRIVISLLAGAVVVGGFALASFHSTNALGIAAIIGTAGSASYYSLPNQVGILLGAGGITEALRITATTIFLLTYGWLLWRTWHGAFWLQSATWAILVLLLTTTWLVPWYIIWLLPLVALSGSRRLTVISILITLGLVAQRIPMWERIAG
jgi:hypothetical protein